MQLWGFWAACRAVLPQGLCAGCFGVLMPLYLTEFGWLYQPRFPDCPLDLHSCPRGTELPFLLSTLAAALLAADWGEDANHSALWLSLQTPASLIIH